MALDLFRLLLIELGEFRTRGVVDPQKFIQFGMQRQIVAAVGSLDEERHRKYRQRRDRIPLERGRTERQPEHRIKHDEEEGGGMSRRLPDMCGPMPFGGFRHGPLSYLDVRLAAPEPQFSEFPDET